ncbi:hypothetical protein WH47_07304, partial [Habropoda laboriosa]
VVMMMMMMMVMMVVGVVVGRQGLLAGEYDPLSLSGAKRIGGGRWLAGSRRRRTAGRLAVTSPLSSMSTGVVGPSSPTATSPPGPPVTDEVVSSSSSLAPATVPVPPPPSDSFVGGDFLFEDILNLKRNRETRLG